MENKTIKIGSYKIFFPEGEFYIGSAYGIGGFDYRWKCHKNGRKSSPEYLQKTALKYGGWSNDNIKFIILEETKTKEEALQSEQKYINEYWTDDFKEPLLLNKKRFVMEPLNMYGKNHPNFGKPGTMLGKYHTEATKQKISKGNKGKTRTKETREKISKAQIGKHASEETKRKMRENHPKLSGKNHHRFGKKQSEETKEKIRKGNKGKKQSEEAKKLLSEIHKGEKNPNSKFSWDEVREIREKYKTGNYTIKQLMEYYKVDRKSIYNILHNKSWKE